MSVAMAVRVSRSSGSAPVPVGVRAGRRRRGPAGLARRVEERSRRASSLRADEAPRSATARWTSWSCPARRPPTATIRLAAESRAARLVLDDALKRAGGAPNPWTAAEEHVSVPGVALRGLADPRPRRHGDHRDQRVGHRRSRSCRPACASCSSAWWRARCAAATTCCAQVLARLLFLLPEVAVPLLFGRYVHRHAAARIAGGAHRGRRSCGALSCGGHRPACRGEPHQDASRPISGLVEPDPAADVDCQRRVLLGVAVSRRAAAVRPGAAADRARGRAARRHPRGRRWPRLRSATELGDSRRLGHRSVRHRA